MLRGAGSQGEAIPKECSAPRFHPMVSILAREKLFSLVEWGWEEAKDSERVGREGAHAWGGKERTHGEGRSARAPKAPALLSISSDSVTI